MCGIFGWSTAPSLLPTTLELVNQFFSTLQHRGPDDSGWLALRQNGNFVDTRTCCDHSPDVIAVLGQTRLSIIDLSPAGHQPMVSPCGRLAITYNGEIYNYRELREQLVARGRTFSTHTDTEVLLAAFKEWGLDCLSRLEGMFAFALLDRTERRLYCVRDFFGIKPFFYATPAQGFCFASELPALLLFPGVARTANAQRIYDYLMRGDVDSGEDSMVRGIKYLPPAHFLVIDCDSGKILAKKRYWTPSLETHELTYSEASERLHSLLARNIERHLRSDVPLGAALSGGVDSSAIVCGIRKVAPEQELHTFTYIAAEAKQSEEQWADLVCRHAGTIPHKTRDAESVESLLLEIDDIIRFQGEPFASTSIYAQYRVFKLARENGIKVMLEGQGADELFAGYLGFPGERIHSLVKAGSLLSAARFFKNTSHWPDRSASLVLQMTANAVLPPALVPLARCLGNREPRPSWMQRRWFEQTNIQPRRNYSSIRWDGAGNQEMKKALAQRLCVRGLPNLLRHGDRNAMRFSIENRVPFLTREMAEFALSLPESYLVDETGRTKAILKDALRDWLPNPLQKRRDKIGFATSETKWLRTLEPKRASFKDELESLQMFNMDALEVYWDKALTTAHPRETAMVWRWINLARWSSTFNIHMENKST